LNQSSDENLRILSAASQNEAKSTNVQEILSINNSDSNINAVGNTNVTVTSR